MRAAADGDRAMEEGDRRAEAEATRMEALAAGDRASAEEPSTGASEVSDDVPAEARRNTEACVGVNTGPEADLWETGIGEPAASPAAGGGCGCAGAGRIDVDVDEAGPASGASTYALPAELLLPSAVGVDGGASR